jgi:hypothetical protein
MSVTFRAFQQCLPLITAINKPVLLRSRHGVGKSEMVYQYAETIGKRVVSRRASQMTEGDLLGLPKINSDRTEYLPPDWLKESCDEGVVLFLDELDRATPEVRQGFFQMADSRSIAGWTLHPDTLIFSAVNGGEHGEQYQVGEMDPAELDRWTVFDLEPDVEDWLLWAKSDGNINRVIIDFIREEPKHLEHNSDFEPNKVYPSRRSWHRFSDCVNKSTLIEPGSASATLFNVANAFLGLEAAIGFQDFVRNYQKIVTAEDILEKGDLDLIKDFDINDHSALIDKIDDYLQKKYKSLKPKGKDKAKLFDEKLIEKVVDYFVLAPSECAMVLWKKLATLDINVTIQFHKAKNGEFKKHLVSMLQADPKLVSSLEKNQKDDEDSDEKEK